MSKEDMRKCPFCKGTGKGEAVYLKKEVGGVVSVRCPDCGLMAVFNSPKAGVALKAGRIREFTVERWNTRAGDE